MLTYELGCQFSKRNTNRSRVSTTPSSPSKYNKAYRSINGPPGVFFWYPVLGLASMAGRHRAPAWGAGWESEGLLQCSPGSEQTSSAGGWCSPKLRGCLPHTEAPTWGSAAYFQKLDYSRPDSPALPSSWIPILQMTVFFHSEWNRRLLQIHFLKCWSCFSSFIW